MASSTNEAVQPATTYAEATEAEKHAVLRKVTGSSFLGNFIEWFDYASYSYLATVIAMVFFPAEDRAVAVMSTFGVFALSFLVRPIGAIFWGNMGDKKGRKWALSVSILLMSGATFLIGCLPGYAVIGVGAPLLLLLLRMVQSFSAAGEHAGAATFIAEYAPHNHRGFYCSMVPASTATGLLVGSLLATFMFTVWGADSSFVVDWGWRIRSGWRFPWATSPTTSVPIWRIPRCTPRCRSV
ncbi:MAG: MFS transporter [Adlercreutzia equolifaciens]